MDRDLIKRKLEELVCVLKELEQLRGTDVATLRKSLRTAWSVEHGLQIAIKF